MIFFILQAVGELKPDLFRYPYSRADDVFPLFYRALKSNTTPYQVPFSRDDGQYALIAREDVDAIFEARQMLNGEQLRKALSQDAMQLL